MTEPRMHTTPSTDGVEVTWYEHGGTGPLLALCHATGFHGRCYDVMAAVLVRDFTVIAVDVRGHGRTERPDGVSMAWIGAANDVHAAVEAARAAGLGDGSATFGFGHSMGGCAATLAELEFPGTFDAIWGFEPIIFPTPEMGTVHESPLVQGARRRRDHFDSIEEVRERYGSKLPLSLLDPRCLDDYVTHGFRPADGGGVTLRCTPENEAQTFEHSLAGVYERLADLRARFGVAHSGDGEMPAVMGARLCAENSHFVPFPYPDLTHFGPFQQPERIAADLRAFFAG